MTTTELFELTAEQVQEIVAGLSAVKAQPEMDWWLAHQRLNPEWLARVAAQVKAARVNRPPKEPEPTTSIGPYGHSMAPF